jgi:hypothetical protein
MIDVPVTCVYVSLCKICSEFSLGSWIKPLGFDLCQCGLWDIIANDRDPQRNNNKTPRQLDNRNTPAERTLHNTVIKHKNENCNRLANPPLANCQKLQIRNNWTASVKPSINSD